MTGFELSWALASWASVLPRCLRISPMKSLQGRWTTYMVAQSFWKYKSRNCQDFLQAQLRTGTEPLWLPSIGEAEWEGIRFHEGAEHRRNGTHPEGTVHWRPAITEAVCFSEEHSGCGEGIVVRQEWEQRGQLGGNVLVKGCVAWAMVVAVNIENCRWVWEWGENTMFTW